MPLQHSGSRTVRARVGVECAKASMPPSINLPVDVSSIGSVADRREMPSGAGVSAARSGYSVPRELRQIEHDHKNARAPCSGGKT